jgi:hypothetical protein
MDEETVELFEVNKAITTKHKDGKTRARQKHKLFLSLLKSSLFYFIAAFSTKLHKDLMRIAVKTILLCMCFCESAFLLFVNTIFIFVYIDDNETFTDEDFQEFRVPFRKICNLVQNCCIIRRIVTDYSFFLQIKNNFARGVWDEALVSRIAELVVSIEKGLVVSFLFVFQKTTHKCFVDTILLFLETFGETREKRHVGQT